MVSLCCLLRIPYNPEDLKMTEAFEPKPGEPFVHEQDGKRYVFVASDVSDGCMRCVARNYTRLCDLLPNCYASGRTDNTHGYFESV